MSTMMLEILSPDKTIYWGKAESVTVKAIDGELTVLPGHAPIVTVLGPGEIRMHKEEDQTCHHYKHAGGILDVSKEKTSVLVILKEDKAKKPDEKGQADKPDSV